MNNTLLKCDNLTKKYNKFEALNIANLEIKSGKIIGLLGPNGSGKTTLIKIINSLLTPTSGEVLINNKKPGVESKSIISYLPDRNYLNNNYTVEMTLNLFEDFYKDFDRKRALDMLKSLNIDPKQKLKSMSKGTKEKVQLILVMSRRASLYILDEPIAGVDPAARDFILNTIISNYDENATVIISTHLIADIEKVLDEVIFLKNGSIFTYKTVDEIREETGKSVDEYFREVFKC